jgi:hypothetical protein
MPNQRFMQRLFPAGELVLMISKSPEEHLDLWVKDTIAAINMYSSAEYLYLANMDVKSFSHIKLHLNLICKKFLAIGLEKVSENTLLEIVDNLPATVTTIGITDFSVPTAAKALRALGNLIHKQPDITLIIGDNFTEHHKTQLLLLNPNKTMDVSTVSIATYAATATKKRKLPDVETPHDLISKQYNKITELESLNIKLTREKEEDEKLIANLREHITQLSKQLLAIIETQSMSGQIENIVATLQQELLPRIPVPVPTPAITIELSYFDPYDASGELPWSEPNGPESPVSPTSVSVPGVTFFHPQPASSSSTSYAEQSALFQPFVLDEEDEEEKADDNLPGLTQNSSSSSFRGF